jgi:hypothetical protein
LALFGFASIRWQRVRFLHNPLSKPNLSEFRMAGKLALFCIIHSKWLTLFPMICNRGLRGFTR